jgi:hypothetical protein
MAVTQVSPIRPAFGLARPRRRHRRHRAFGKRRPRRGIVPPCRLDVGVAVTNKPASPPAPAPKLLIEQRVSLMGRHGPRAKAELEVWHSGRAMAAHGARTGADRLRHRNKLPFRQRERGTLVYLPVADCDIPVIVQLMNRAYRGSGGSLTGAKKPRPSRTRTGQNGALGLGGMG